MMLQTVRHDQAWNPESDVVAYHLIQGCLIQFDGGSFAFNHDQWIALCVMAYDVSSSSHAIEFEGILCYHRPDRVVQFVV